MVWIYGFYQFINLLKNSRGEQLMRKKFLMISISIFSLFLLGNSKSYNDGILLKYFPIESVVKQSIQVSKKDPINEIILLPEQKFDQKEAASIIMRLQTLPDTLLLKINEQNIRVKLFVGKLTDNPTADHLSGIIPEGYRSQRTWDDVPGIGGGKTVLVKIGNSQQGKGHGSVNLELHELAHSIDKYVFHEIRYNPIFLNIWREEVDLLFPNHSYFLTYAEEYFAESFALYYFDEESRAFLQLHAPKTYEFIRNLK